MNSALPFWDLFIQIPSFCLAADNAPMRRAAWVRALAVASLASFDSSFSLVALSSLLQRLDLPCPFPACLSRLLAYGVPCKPLLHNGWSLFSASSIGTPVDAICLALPTTSVWILLSSRGVFFSSLAFLLDIQLTTLCIWQICFLPCWEQSRNRGHKFLWKNHH